jgi:copper chaperone CopZ
MVMTSELAADPLTEKLPAKPQNGRLVQIKASGMMCSFCTMSVEKALGRMDGVDNVQVNLVHGVILVDRDPAKIKAERLEQAVESLGYTVSGAGARHIQSAAPSPDHFRRARPVAACLVLSPG